MGTFFTQLFDPNHWPLLILLLAVVLLPIIVTVLLDKGFSNPHKAKKKPTAPSTHKKAKSKETRNQPSNEKN